MKTHDNTKGDICRYSLFRGWMLDNGIRRLFQNPKNIISDYVAEGMTAIDIGCGTGMFTLAMAEMVGNTGTVIAVDVQQEMVDQVRLKSRKQNLISRIQFHKSELNQIGVVEKADFILSFYMVHEVPDRDAFLKEVHGLLKPGGKYLVVEPVFHVSEIAFSDTIRLARSAGFKLEGNPKIWLSRAALFSLAD
jgi:ubiquinone/menaquinone biosynthesis C-methylase UbiE